MSFRLHYFILGAIGFSLFIVVMTSMAGEVSTNYDDVNITTNGFENTFNKIDTIYNETESRNRDILGNEIEEDNTESGMFKGAFKAFRRVDQTKDLSVAVIDDTMTEFKIPGFIKVFAITALMVSIIFALVAFARGTAL